ncbi:hypothetical protein ILUMI_10803 [Ignelater luminosus]|uniref:Single domain-containing protein n=1 Tax=Ignelater luminosus TaxID=2038154 RepID=A0A8K0CX78_IGNLU|nr:hypothetical protein ILUMI_10803 [Ignelater luminosus]
MYKVLIFAVAVIATATCLPAVNDDELVGKYLSYYNHKPGYCRIGNVYIKEGERGPGPIGECNVYTCTSAKPGEMSIFVLTCPEFIPAPGCHESDYDYTKQHPDCCPKHVCPNEH